MTDYVSFGFQTVLPVGFTSFATGDSLTIASFSTLFVPGLTIGIQPNATQAKLHIYGQLDALAVELGGASYVTIGRDGSLVSNNTNIAALTLGGAGGSLLENHGSISAVSCTAVLAGTNDKVVNDGIISGTSGVIFGPSLTGGAQLSNLGTISGRSYAVQVLSPYASISNSGHLEADVFQTVDISGDYNPTLGVFIGTLQSMQNSGTVLAHDQAAIVVNLGAASSEFHLRNTGTVTSESYAYFSNTLSIDVIRNTGVMNGNLQLAGGEDEFDGRSGTVNGDLDLGDGADLADLRGAVMNGVVVGGTGADTYFVSDGGITIIEAGADIDTVYSTTTFRLAASIENLTLLDASTTNGSGNTLGNLINGNSADNRLNGFDGNDTINGDLGNDRLLGGIGNDSLTGDDGEDAVLGHAGTDTVRGGEGDDSLNGGAGKDLYVGNNGADLFQFAALAHTANTQATADVISDFIAGDDIIVISAIDANRINTGSNDTFTFIGTAAFTAAGQARYVQSGGNTYVELEVTGDNVADAMIKLTGLISLNASDFTL